MNPKTNLDWIRALPPEELAPVLLQTEVEHTIDYDWDETPIDGPDVVCYVTSDGTKFENWNDAFEHEIWWLRQPATP